MSPFISLSLGGSPMAKVPVKLGVLSWWTPGEERGGGNGWVTALPGGRVHGDFLLLSLGCAESRRWFISRGLAYSVNWGSLGVNPCAVTLLATSCFLSVGSVTVLRMQAGSRKHNRVSQTLVMFSVCWLGKGVNYCEHWFSCHPLLFDFGHI